MPWPAREPRSGPRHARFLLAVGLLAAAVAGFYAYVTLDTYREMLSGSGRHVPPASATLLDCAPLLLALAPLLVLAVWRLWPKPAARGMAAAMAGGVLVMCLPALVAATMSSLALR